METYFKVNLKGYLGALEVNTGNIMVSYSAINGHSMSINSELLQGLLKDELGFDGILKLNFIIQDLSYLTMMQLELYPVEVSQQLE